MNFYALETALQLAANEGRNVMPSATDDQAAVIEAFALHLLGALEVDLDREHYQKTAT